MLSTPIRYSADPEWLAALEQHLAARGDRDEAPVVHSLNEPAPGHLDEGMTACKFVVLTRPTLTSVKSPNRVERPTRVGAWA